MNSRKSHSKMLQSEVFSVGQSTALTYQHPFLEEEAEDAARVCRDQHRKLLQACCDGGRSVDAAVQVVLSELDKKRLFSTQVKCCAALLLAMGWW